MYRAQELIAHGGLASVYTAIAPTGAIVALKKQHVTKHVAHPMLRHEACAMEILKGHPSIPLVDAWARSQYYEYLTMQLLGPSTADLFTSGKLPDITTAARLAVQMLDVVFHIHSRHVIHGDIKPCNFLFGVHESSERVHVVDFGFASYYRDPRTLIHRPLETDQKFRGTSFYASLNAHRRQSSSRRDDMESLAYTFLEFALGTLPWHDIRKFTIIGLEKEAWTGAELAADIPSVFGIFLDYTRALRFEEEPDYLRWRKAFSGVVSGPSSAGLATERAFEKRVAVPHAVASSDSEDDYGVSAESDDHWSPICSGPDPHGVAVRNLFGDEDTLIFKAASLMTDVPTMPSRDIYNTNEQLVPLVGAGAMDDHDEASCSRRISNYTQGLRCEEEPDHSRWRKAFRAVVRDPSSAGPATERAFEKRVVVPHAAASSDSEDDYGVSAESDDNWYPVCSGPAPHGVAVGNLFGDEDTLIRKAASLMTDVPTMPSRDIYNNNEQLIPLVGAGAMAMDDHDEANCSRQISKVECDGSSIPKI